MGAEGNIWRLALSSAILGMGVVFVALFLLSIYMNVFKRLLTRLHQKRELAALAERESKTRELKEKSQPQPPEGDAPEVGEEARIAAAVAVGLHLGGERGAADGATAAAVAVALELYGKPTSAPRELGTRTPRWKAAGWLEAHGLSARGRGRHRAS